MINVAAAPAKARRPTAPVPPPPSSDRRILFGMLAKTTVTMLFAGLLPLALFAGIFLVDQSRRIRVQSDTAMRENAARVSKQVDEWLDKNVRALRAAAAAPGMASMRVEEQTALLIAMQKAYPWMYLTHTMALDGRNIARNDGKPMADYADRIYYRDVLNGKELAWETVIGKTSKKPAVVLAVPIKQDGTLVGVLAAAMNIEDISRIVAQLKIGETGYAFLVDEKSKVVAHPHEEFVLTQRVLNDHPLITAFAADGALHSFSFLQADGKLVLGAVQGNSWRWAVAVQQEESELFAPLRHMVTVAGALLAISAVLLALIAWAFSRMLVKPILAMAAAADAMSMGELERPMPASRRDELGILGRSLERLRKSMKAAMDRIESGR